jgi:hypothetical protein
VKGWRRQGIALGIAMGSMFSNLPGATQPLSAYTSDPVAPSPAQRLRDLINALDLTRPELASTAAALNRNDFSLAEKELAHYFRTRTSVGWESDVATSNHLSPLSQLRVVNALKGAFQGGPPPVYSFPNGRIDWHFNATNNVAGQTPNNEWQWQLNRMSFWSDLSIAYRTTGDERYAAVFVQGLRSWIQQCPPPDHLDNGPGSSWRTIEVGIRTGGPWMDAFFSFRRSLAMTDADIVDMVDSFHDQGKFLRTNHTRLNWLTMEMSGLYSIGAVFPEFKEAAEWRSFAANTLAEQSHQQFLPDGGQVELSSSYQNVALGNILHIADVAQWTGHTPELLAGYIEPLEKPYEWQMDIVAPDGFLPKVNDADATYLPAVLTKATVYFPHNSEFQWFVSNGAEGSPPPFTSVFLNRSGLVAMRSGWEHDANYLLFRVGPLGMNHQHQESLGVDVWAYGRELIFDGGGGSYENSKWRQWAISSFAHNTVLVDGMAQTRTASLDDPFKDPALVSQGPIDANWRSSAVFDFASGVYSDGYGPSHTRITAQRREVLFLKPDMYVIADRFQPSDSLPHRFQARWQLLTTHSGIDPSTKTLTTDDSGIANIAVVPLLVDHLDVGSASGQQSPEILGWNFRRDASPELVPATTLLHTLTGSGPRMLLTLLVPLRPGGTSPIVAVEPGKDGVSATAIFKDGRRLLISCAGSQGISVRETSGERKSIRSVAAGK